MDDAQTEKEEAIPPDGMPGVGEPELVARARKADPDAYSALFARYHRKIYGLTYNMTRNREDAEDLVQEVFIKAYEALPRFKGQSSFYTWIYRIAVNRSINFVKKRQRRQTQDLEEMDPGVVNDAAYVALSARYEPVRTAGIHELQEKLNEMLGTLSEKHRTVIVLHDVQGMTHDQIAEVLSCSPGTVRSRLFYARRQLEPMLETYR